jgi:hypothetical protein
MYWAFDVLAKGTRTISVSASTMIELFMTGLVLLIKGLTQRKEGC